MRVGFVLTFVFSLFFAQAIAQPTLDLEIKSGYASYAMNDLSQSIQFYTLSSTYPLKITDNYPAFVTFGGTLLASFRKIGIGIDYNYYSTGARTQYKDYSGEVGYDQAAKANAIGVVGKYTVLQKKRFAAKGSLLLSMYYSSVNFNQYLNVSGTQNNNSLDASSTAFSATPSLETTYKFKRFLYSGLRMGYCFGAEGSLHVKGNSSATLTNQYHNDIHTQWSGFRSEIFIGIRLSSDLSKLSAQ